MKYFVMWGAGMFCDSVWDYEHIAKERMGYLKESEPKTEIWIDEYENLDGIYMKDFDDDFEDFLQDDFS